VIPAAQVTFYSAQRIDVSLDPKTLGVGPHDVTVTNPDGDSVTLSEAFSIDNQGNVTPGSSLKVQRGAGVTTTPRRPRVPKLRGRRTRPQVPIQMGGTASPGSARPSTGAPDPIVARQIDELREDHQELVKKVDGQSQEIIDYIGEMVEQFQQYMKKQEKDLESRLAHQEQTLEAKLEAKVAEIREKEQ
jgi:hypothetical protein